jgi:hypothetical protein
MISISITFNQETKNFLVFFILSIFKLINLYQSEVCVGIDKLRVLDRGIKLLD